MKKYIFALVITVLALPAFADQPKRTDKFLFGEIPAEITKEQCTHLESIVGSRLQAFAASENLPADTFSVTTKIGYGHDHEQTVALCYGNFKSKDPRYDFLENKATPRYGPDRNSKCAEDRQIVEGQINVVALKDGVDLGLDFHRNCRVRFISIERK